LLSHSHVELAAWEEPQEWIIITDNDYPRSSQWTGLKYVVICNYLMSLYT
jgi:hypothetical protein